MRKIKKNKNKSLHGFVTYTISIVSITLLLIGLLTIKNECSRLKNEIIEFNKICEKFEYLIVKSNPVILRQKSVKT